MYNRILLLPAFLLLSIPSSLQAGEWSGNVSLEGRYFFHDGQDTRQQQQQLSMSFQPEYYTDWNDRKDSFTFEPFIRIDSRDDARSHADIREAIWVHAEPQWELRAGIGKVFWGVTESQHLVDIINQTDLVENLDGEDKLGQPMLQLSWIQDWGTLSGFVLPYFRERTYPGASGRLRSLPHVDDDHPRYESSRERHHVDWALRWSHAFDIWDIGVSHFSGTTRDPRFLPGFDNGRPVLIPYYEQINQTGLDLQATIGSWLWKLEWIHRRGQGEAYHALTGGFEYTLYGVFETDHDLGLLAEALYDDRGRDAPTPFEEDLFLGARWLWNNAQDTQFLAGVIQDINSSERVMRLEGSHRLQNGLKLNVEAQLFSNLSRRSALHSMRDDDFVQIELGWYF